MGYTSCSTVITTDEKTRIENIMKVKPVLSGIASHRCGSEYIHIHMYNVMRILNTASRNGRQNSGKRRDQYAC